MIYLTPEEVIYIHDIVLKNSKWLTWLLNIGQIESLLTHIANNDYYPTLTEKVTHLFFWLTQFHCFNDGNKRTAIITSFVFLIKNDIYIEDYIIKMEDIAVWVAKWEIDKATLLHIFKSMFISFWFSE
ncbi:MAG: hypothetical protein ACD_3C00083G0004 [uncultured bacterium (gcode 4)]|uniref:Fido domain-containing protein n=1 Tax=uncultured bacterium (gcode 4) TaxID=1234023 RepID=K2GXU0_9BACT|nr:MAG: hypothetical protein ACD_3C00083G0004 [uncultured bacterium (gcode 4)]